MTTASAGPAALLRNYWNQELLRLLESELLASDLAESQVIAANSGKVIEFHRISNFPKQATGVTQIIGVWDRATSGQLKGSSFTVDSVVYSLELLTNDLSLSEMAIMCAEPNPLPALTEEFLYNAKDTIDQRMINKMVGNVGSTQNSTASSVSYGGASVSVTSVWGDGSQTLTEATLDADNPSHRIAAETFNSAYTQLRINKAKPRDGSIYDCLISPEIAGDLRLDGTFQDIALKGMNRGEDKFEKASIGNVFGVRVMEDQNVSVGLLGTIDTTNDYIIRCPVIGRGFIKRISHAKGIGVPRVNYIPPGQVDKADPYGLQGIMTWKVYDTDGGILNPLAGLVIRVATIRARSTAGYDDQWSNNTN